MGKEVTVKAGYSNVWLYAGGVFNGGDEATLTDAEYTALGDHQAQVTLGSTVADPDRTVAADADLETLADALNAHLNDTTAAHAASAISFDGAEANVQDAVEAVSGG